MLADAPLIAFASTADPDASRAFYEGTIGLEFVADEPWALVFDAVNATLRVAKVESLAPAPGAVLGWEVDDVHAAVEWLSAECVEFIRYDGVEQDDPGVASFPDGTQVAWFADPDGNVLSLSAFDGDR